jgi:hypothetical protein
MSGKDVMAYFACPVVTSSYIYNRNSLFFFNLKSSISRLNVLSITISDRSSSSAIESYGTTKPDMLGASASTFATAGARSSTTGASASEITPASKSSLVSKSTPAAM